MVDYYFLMREVNTFQNNNVTNKPQKQTENKYSYRSSHRRVFTGTKFKVQQDFSKSHFNFKYGQPHSDAVSRSSAERLIDHGIDSIHVFKSKLLTKN